MFPLFATGEPKRNYTFQWYVTPKSNFFLGAVSALYISNLASKVDLPTQEIEIETVKIGLVDFPVPKGIKINTIQVDYLEDDLGNVERVHRIWQGSAKGGVARLSVSALSRFAGVAIYIPTTDHFASPEVLSKIASDVQQWGFGSISFKGDMTTLLNSGISEVPTGLQIYPRVFPISVTPTQVTRDGQAFAGVRVTYVRIPSFSGWTPLETTPAVPVGTAAGS